VPPSLEEVAPHARSDISSAMRRGPIVFGLQNKVKQSGTIVLDKGIKEKREKGRGRGGEEERRRRRESHLAELENQYESMMIPFQPEFIRHSSIIIPFPGLLQGLFS